MNLRVDDVQNVQVSDVVTLVEHVQQVSVQSINSLVDLLTTSPVLASSAAAALLVAVLLGRAKSYRAGDSGTPHNMLRPPQLAQHKFRHIN
jgi:hypothetical protein